MGVPVTRVTGHTMAGLAAIAEEPAAQAALVSSRCAGRLAATHLRVRTVISEAASNR